jgi:hypothetical protein
MQQYKSIKTLRKLGPRLLGADLQARTHESLEEELKEFLFGYTALGITRNVGQIWHRARALGEKHNFDDLHELIYPPEPPNYYGRARLPDTNVMYGAWNWNTAWEEVNIAPGERAHLISYRPLPGIEFKCHVVGEYHRFNLHGKSFITDLSLRPLRELKRSDPDRFAAAAYIDGVISRLFRRDVAKDRNYDYKLTAIYSKIFHSAGGGLIYPSARNPVAANLALHPRDFDLQFEVIGTHVIIAGARCEEKVRLLRSGVDFEQDGTIKWCSSLVRPMIHDKGFGWREVTPLPGWRKPGVRAPAAK